jgi:hypothetical protein
MKLVYSVLFTNSFLLLKSHNYLFLALASHTFIIQKPKGSILRPSKNTSGRS